MNDFREGFSAIPRHLFGTLTAYELAVVAAIHSRYPNAYPSHHLLAHDAGMSVSSAQRTLVSLQKKGLVEIRSGKDEGKTNDYILTTAFLRGVGQSDRGGRSERPTGSVRVTDEVEQASRTTKENKELRARSARGKDSMKTIGNLDDPEPPPTRYPLTHKGTVEYFSNEARRLRAHGGIPRLRKTISVLHKEDGLSYDQIQGMVRYFFLHYEEEIRWMNKEYTATALFQSKLQRIKNADPKPITYEEPDEEDKWAELLG